MTQIVKVNIKLKNLNDNTNIDKVIKELYFSYKPTKNEIKEEIEKSLNVKLETRDYSPEEGGDFGAYFYIGDMYITYNLVCINVINNKEA